MTQTAFPRFFLTAGLPRTGLRAKTGAATVPGWEIKIIVAAVP